MALQWRVNRRRKVSRRAMQSLAAYLLGLVVPPNLHLTRPFVQHSTGSWIWLTAPLLPLALVHACIEVDPSFQGSAVASTSASSTVESNSLDVASTSADEGHSDGDSTVHSNSITMSSTTVSELSSNLSSNLSSDSETTTAWTDTTTSTDSEISSSWSTSSESSTSAEESSETATTTTEACIEVRCFAVNEDRTYNNAIYATGGNLAFRLDGDGQAHAIVAIEILSGETNGTSQLAVRSNSGGLPGSLLGRADFHISQPNDWKKAVFENPVEVPGNADFWVDWTSISGAQAPIAVNGSSIPQAYRASAGDSWSLAGSRLAMIRVWCCDP